MIHSMGIRKVLSNDSCQAYSVDGVMPSAVLFPETVEEISKALALADREGFSCVPYGGGTKMALGNLVRNVDMVIGMSMLNGVIDYQPSDLTVTVQAGATLDEVQGILKDMDQFIPLETPWPSKATIGGILATGYNGPLSLTYGLPRDWIIGVTVVNPDGTVTKSGGRVVKNVTGYDLNKLYTGSLGTLGVIAEATFKLSSKPANTCTVIASFSRFHDAMNAMEHLLKDYGGPSAAVVINHETGLMLGLMSKGYKIIALYHGSETVLKAKCRSGLLTIRNNRSDRIDYEGSDLVGIWQSLADLPWIGNPTPTLSIKFSVLPSRVAMFTRELESIFIPSFRHGIISDFGNGYVRSLWWGDKEIEITADVISRVTSKVQEFGASWIIERCPTTAKALLDVWGQQPSSIKLIRDVKAKLDPKRVLNPGRFIGGI